MEEYLEFAKDIAYQAGKIMIKYFNQDNDARYKGDRTIVTIADTEINSYLIKRVKEKYPTHAVDGEEEKFGESDFVWVCDPIDGTAMYARNIPVAVFSLALVVKGEPIVGVVYDPFTDRLYTAIKGNGAYKNNEKIHVNNYELDDMKTVCNCDIWADADYDINEIIKELGKNTYFVSIGSVIRGGMCVATGDFTCGIFPGTIHKNCDIAAVKVIVEEAGGKVTDLFGNEQRYDKYINGAIISNKVASEKIIEKVKEHLENQKTIPEENSNQPKVAFAIYSSDDNSLRFYKRTYIPSVNEYYNNRIVSAVYTGFETEEYDNYYANHFSPEPTPTTPWKDVARFVQTVVVVDRDITPISLKNWFCGFNRCQSMHLDKLNTSNVKSLASTFNECFSLSSLDLHMWDTSNVTDLSLTFYECRSLLNLNINDWNTTKVKYLSNTFNCFSLSNLDLSKWDISNVQVMNNTFNHLFLIRTLNLSGWNIANVKEVKNPFIGIGEDAVVYIGNNCTEDVIENLKCNGCIVRQL